MTGTKDLPLSADSQRLDAMPPPSPSQHPSAQEILLLLRVGTAETIVSSPDKASPDTLSDALTNDAGPTAARQASPSKCYDFEGWQAHLNSVPPIGWVGRFESLNDASGSERRVYRKSPHPPRHPRSLP